MKKKKRELAIPDPTTAEVHANLPKSETIHMRVTKSEKSEVVASATSLHLSTTDYLLKCHAVIASKLRNGR